MNNRILMILLLCLLLISLFAPFSGLALLMFVLFVAAFFSIVWTMVRTLLFGNPNEES